MENAKRFWKSAVIGAIVGGAVSLIHEETRKAVIHNLQKGYQHFVYCVKHPDEVLEQVKETSDKIHSTVKQVGEDIDFIREKVKELQEVTPSVVSIIKDTKEAFCDREKKSV